MVIQPKYMYVIVVKGISICHLYANIKQKCQKQEPEKQESEKQDIDITKPIKLTTEMFYELLKNNNDLVQKNNELSKQILELSSKIIAAEPANDK